MASAVAADAFPVPVWCNGLYRCVQRKGADVKRLPYPILILFGTTFIAAADPTKPSSHIHETVAKAYYS